MKKYFYIAILFLFPCLTFADNIQIIKQNIDVSTLQKGYTVSTPNHRFRLGFNGRTFKPNDQAVRIILKKVAKSEYNLTDQHSISGLYSYKIKSSSIIKIRKKHPLWLRLKYQKKEKGQKIIRIWNEKDQTWKDLNSAKIENRKVVQATTKRISGIIGVFNIPEEIETPDEVNYQIGYASWYDYHGAASTTYPFGSIVRVTNLDNDLSCEVTIVDYGPFIEGRIIDLPREAFAAIADLGTGVIPVKVEPIYIPE